MTVDLTTAKPTARLFLLGMLMALITIGLDQLSKQWVFALLAGDTQEVVLTSFFSLVKVWNFGISFGMFAASRQPTILSGVSLVIVLVLIGWLTKTPYRMVAIALGLIIGGAVGNMIDRMRFGAVADFLDFHLLGHHWPAFNVADSCIFIGVVFLCIHSMLVDSKKTS